MIMMNMINKNYINKIVGSGKKIVEVGDVTGDMIQINRLNESLYVFMPLYTNLRPSSIDSKQLS